MKRIILFLLILNLGLYAYIQLGQSRQTQVAYPLPEIHPEKIEILNLLGSIISTFGNERLLDLSSYHDGIYLIRTITDEGIELKRVEVIH